MASMEVEPIVSNGNDGKKRRSRRKGSKKKKEKSNEHTFVTITPPVIREIEDHKVLVSLFTKQRQYAVPRYPIEVSDDINREGLNKLTHSLLLNRSTFNGTPPQFDFLVEGIMLHGKLVYRLNSSQTISREGGVSIEYLETLPEPTPQDSLNHDDWVSSLSYSKRGLLLTGCYDHTIHIWRPRTFFTDKKRESKLSDDETAHLLKVPAAHKAPVKAVAWIPRSDDMFISCGMDQAVLVWQYDSSHNSVRCVYRCRGHKTSVESLAAGADGLLFATGSSDGELKIWTTDEEGVIDPADEGTNPDPKKIKSNVDPPKSKTPRHTLKHNEIISGLVWPTLSTLASCSWDYSVQLWDVDRQIKLSSYVAPCSCLALDSSPFNNTLLVATIDTHIRLLDPRDTGGLALSQTFKHHKKWASSVKWSPSDDKHFVSGGYDNIVKLWDIRSPTAPLYEMTGHTDKVMAVDWSRAGVVFSGSADTNVKIITL